MGSEKCEKCNGTGWLLTKRADLEEVMRCTCFKKQVKDILYDEARIPKHYQRCDLDNYEPLNQSLKAALGTARGFAKKYPAKIKSGLFFIGPCGVGKTHLSVGIIKYLLKEKGVPCLFYDFRDLLKAIQNTYSDKSNISEQAVLHPVLNKEVLVLDELGSQKMSDWVQDMLMYVINQRYNEDKITIFTSNYFDRPSPVNKNKVSKNYGKRASAGESNKEQSLGDRIGFRLRSRLVEMCKFISVEGDDYRELKQAGY